MSCDILSAPGVVLLSYFVFHPKQIGFNSPSSQWMPGHKWDSYYRINFSAEGIVITFLRTKSIQFGRRRLHIPLVRLDTIFCPVRAYRLSLEKLGALRGSLIPAFAFRERGKLTWLTKDIFIDTLREITSRFATGDELFTGHSFRRGGATWAFQSGLPGELIQVMGDWSSDCYKRYLEFSMQNKLQLSSFFSRNLSKGFTLEVYTSQ